MLEMRNLGNIVIVINGIVVRDNIDPFFLNSTTIKPVSFKGKLKKRKYPIEFVFIDKLVLLKSYDVGYWYQPQGHISNVNVFRCNTYGYKE